MIPRYKVTGGYPNYDDVFNEIEEGHDCQTSGQAVLQNYAYLLACVLLPEIFDLGVVGDLHRQPTQHYFRVASLLFLASSVPQIDLFQVRQLKVPAASFPPFRIFPLPLFQIGDRQLLEPTRPPILSLSFQLPPRGVRTCGEAAT
ncbi:unnamed protein product [Linum trigynum]|uniref:Uncharacterized protein n=1 Tax=Linum trigynum TaxID=586398 RepID=A0AAV2EWZ0_9ROSI